MNPYAPPNAVVSDIPLKEDIPRPPLVRVATMLLWTDLSVWFLTALFDIPAGKLLKGASPVAAVIALALILGINVWLLAKVAAGRNWARILWLVLSGGGWIVQIRTGLPSGLVDRSSWILQNLICLVVFGILLTPTVARWFKR